MKVIQIGPLMKETFSALRRDGEEKNRPSGEKLNEARFRIFTIFLREIVKVIFFWKCTNITFQKI